MLSDAEVPMRFGLAALAVLLFVSPLFAADIDGKWTGTIASFGDLAVSYTFKADGDKLTGTTTGPDGTEIQLKDGKIEGSNISFNIVLDFGGMPLTIAVKGVMTGEELKLSTDMLGMPFEYTVKKEAVKK